MNKAVFVALLPAFVVTFLLAACDEKTAPAAVGSPPPSMAPTTSGVATPSATVDMSLPLPRGLQGNPDRAAVFFLQNCATCHGTSGDGEGPRAYFINPPPRNFLLASSRQRLNRPTLFNAISKGIVGSEMPAWSKVLSDQEIADLAEFVFQTFISAPQDNKEPGNSGK